MGAIRRGIVSLVAVALAAALGLAARVDAAGTLETIKTRGKLIAGVKTDFPPFGYLEASGKLVGFDVDMAHHFARTLFNKADNVELVSVTSGNRLQFLQEGKIDIVIATMTVTEERRRMVEVSDPYFLSGSLLLVPRASTIRGLEDLGGKTVAVIKGAIQDKDLAELVPKATRVPYAKVPEALAALRSGQADAFTQDDILILTLIKDNPDLKAAGRPFVPRPYGIAVRKGDGEFIAWVNDQLRKMRRDGTYEKLWNKYFGEAKETLVKP